MAVRVATFLVSKISPLAKVNLRTLRLGYELSEQFPERWELLLERLFTGQKSPEATLKLLTQTELPVEEQIIRFRKEMGLSRRSYFNYKRRSGE